MKISICIPQYNRIDFLLKCLQILSKQTYANIELVISDDASTDDTTNQINLLKEHYKYPIMYHRFETNQGYDRNLRKSIELATGDYCFILGNDDTLLQEDAIEKFVAQLQFNQYPDLGFCNYVEDASRNTPIIRAAKTELLGTGPLVALQYYSCFSFVAGLFFKKTSFDKYNTSIFDKSIYAQIALATTMIASGAQLLAINDCLVLKDIRIGATNAITSNSYRDQLIRNWSNFKIVDGGLPSVINVLYQVFSNTKTLDNFILLRIYRKIYRTTLPYWILDYKSNKALPNALGIVFGLWPTKNPSFKFLAWYSQLEILLTYMISSLLALLLPAHWVLKYKHQLYSFIKRS